MIRTVLGDIEPDELGVCYAHEHIIIDESFVTEKYPQLKLDSVENGIEELRQFYKDGGRAMIDSMPADAGRNIVKLAEISRASKVHIVCPTGLHLAIYYDEGHWGNSYSADRLADLFIADIEQGVDRHDYSGPCVERTEHRAGLIKVATGRREPDARERTIFEAASKAHLNTGCPILTHVEQGDGGLEQIELFRSHGVNLSKVVLSHTDRLPDVGYHREMLQSGVRLEYDSAFRWKTEPNHTLELLVQLLEEFPDQIMLGMDAAKPAYWKSYGGAPGLSFLLNEFTRMLKDRGATQAQWEKVFVSAPASVYDFAQPQSP